MSWSCSSPSLADAYGWFRAARERQHCPLTRGKPTCVRTLRRPCVALRTWRCSSLRRDHRPVRHATEEDLDRLETLLVELRKLSQLRERKRGYFSVGGRAFLHFHEDAGDLYVDIRLRSRFERFRVTSPKEQADLLPQVVAAVQVGAEPR